MEAKKPITAREMEIKRGEDLNAAMEPPAEPPRKQIASPRRFPNLSGIPHGRAQRPNIRYMGKPSSRTSFKSMLSESMRGMVKSRKNGGSRRNGEKGNGSTDVKIMIFFSLSIVSGVILFLLVKGGHRGILQPKIPSSSPSRKGRIRVSGFPSAGRIAISPASFSSEHQVLHHQAAITPTTNPFPSTGLSIAGKLSSTSAGRKAGKSSEGGSRAR